MIEKKFNMSCNGYDIVVSYLYEKDSNLPTLYIDKYGTFYDSDESIIVNACKIFELMDSNEDTPFTISVDDEPIMWITEVSEKNYEIRIDRTLTLLVVGFNTYF